MRAGNLHLRTDVTNSANVHVWLGTHILATGLSGVRAHATSGGSSAWAQGSTHLAEKAICHWICVLATHKRYIRLV